MVILASHCRVSQSCEVHKCAFREITAIRAITANVYIQFA